MSQQLNSSTPQPAASSNRWRRLVIGVAISCLTLPVVLSAQAQAQANFPRRPITIYMPYGPGGLADVTMRLYSQKLQPRLGYQLVIESKVGAGGGVAAKAALANPPDGHSLFFCGSGMAISMSLFKTKPFDVVRDFVHISTIANLDELLLATGANSPYNNIQDVLAAARKNPGKLTFGSINPGSTQNLTAHLFKQITGLEFTIVPYRNVPDLIAALMRGDVDVGIDYHAGFQPVAGDPRIKIIATTGEKRSPLLPRVSTIKENGYPEFVVSTWQGLAAPRGVPDDIVRYLNREMVAATNDPEFREQLVKFGMVPGGSTVEAMNASMEREVTKWAEVIKKAGLEPQ